MKSFHSINSLGLILIALITLGIQQFVFPIQSWLYLAAMFFYALNALIYAMFKRNVQRSRAVVNNVMISSMLRLFLSIAFLVIYLLATPYIDKVSVIIFLFYYLFFTAFEIYYLVYKLRPQNKGNANIEK